jgi:hypothetical protein
MHVHIHTWAFWEEAQPQLYVIKYPNYESQNVNYEKSIRAINNTTDILVGQKSHFVLSLLPSSQAMMELRKSWERP